jgi:hypothetical protein
MGECWKAVEGTRRVSAGRGSIAAGVEACTAARGTTIFGKAVVAETPFKAFTGAGVAPSVTEEALAAAYRRISWMIKARGNEATRKPGSKLFKAASKSASCTPETIS